MRALDLLSTASLHIDVASTLSLANGLLAEPDGWTEDPPSFAPEEPGFRVEPPEPAGGFAPGGLSTFRLEPAHAAAHTTSPTPKAVLFIPRFIRIRFRPRRVSAWMARVDGPHQGLRFEDKAQADVRGSSHLKSHHHRLLHRNRYWLADEACDQCREVRLVTNEHGTLELLVQEPLNEHDRISAWRELSAHV